MQHIIHDHTDFTKLLGKFVIQTNIDQTSRTCQDYEWGFLKEKRLKLIINMGYVDLYGNVKQFSTFEEFQKWFNEYDDLNTRCHRLLTASELQYIFQKMKEEIW